MMGCQACKFRALQSHPSVEQNYLAALSETNMKNTEM